MTLPLRARIALLNCAVLLTSFLTLSLISDVGFQQSIERTVNDASRSNLESVRGLLVQSESKGTAEIREELERLSELWAGAGLFQVADQDGEIIFESPAFGNPDRVLPQIESQTAVFFTSNLAEIQYRIASIEIRAGGKVFKVRAAVPTEPFDQALDRFRAILKETLPALVLLASLMSYWLSGRALRPINEMIGAAHQIGVRNLSTRLTVTRAKGELRSLAETLNEMLERIEQSVRRITQFTADASHDLRTPLALIRSNSEFALRKPRTESEYRKALTRNLITSVETARLVENLLALARADAGAADLRFERIDLATHLKQIADDAAVLAEGKNIQLEASDISGPMWVHADTLAIDRVFRIIVENALKYTPRGGLVGISSRATNESTAEVRISDTGIGITEADLPHIFERFYRADLARSRDTGGSGLGLAIARTFVDLHGGTIEVQSLIGTGSVFLIRIPLFSPS